MKQDVLDEVRIIELTKDDPALRRLDYHYSTTSYYDLSIVHKRNNWTMELTLKTLEKVLEKSDTGVFFEQHVNEPRVFAAVLNGDQVGWIEVGYEKWNNRMRVWEFLVKVEFRRKGIGKMLINHAVKVAKEKGARMVVLETQSCNVSAITFYRKQGFDLIGFDSVAYSNVDIKRKEVRLEFGMPL